MFTGVMVAVVTPFKGGELDEDGLRQLIEFQLEDGKQVPRNAGCDNVHPAPLDIPVVQIQVGVSCFDLETPVRPVPYGEVRPRSHPC